MQSRRVAAMLLLVLAAWAPLVQAGTVDDPELTDPANDQVVTGDLDDNDVPGIPNVSDDDFADIDVVAAWFQQGRSDCIGAAPGTCPVVVLVVQTSAQWDAGTLNATFRVEKGPTSYANSTASGQAVSVLVQGTQVTGVANATAAVSPAGLEVRIPIPRIGTVGGDLLSNLTLATSRTDAGFLTHPAFTQDDRTGTDAATATRPYPMLRPAPAAGLDLGVAQTGDKAGNAITLTARQTLDVQLRIINIGTDPDTVIITVSSDPPLERAPTLPDPVTVLQGGSATATVAVPLDGMSGGTIRVTFTATSQRGATDDAVAIIVLDLPVVPRDVKPAGLDFLSPAARSTGFDDAFGSYGELALLSLIVLIVILAIFLLVALAPSTLAGTGSAEAPALPAAAAAAEQAPAAVLAATAAAAAPAAAPAPGPATDFEPEPAPKAAPLAIESVTHEPEAPEEGADVATEVVLRNPGGTRQVRVVLSRDGHDVDEKAITLPARATKTVRLAWTASAGENRVKVRVLPA